MFGKSKESKHRPDGAPFPFLEQVGNEKMMMPYDAIRVERSGATTSVVFIFQGIDVFAMTKHDMQNGDSLTIDGLQGKVELRLTTK